MLINLTVGAKESHFLVDSAQDYDKIMIPRGMAGDSAPLLPPPPPPPPPNAPPPPEICVFQKFGARRRSKLRNFNWDAIPQERVKGRRSLWSSSQCAEELQIDTRRIEELFARQEEESEARRGSWRAQRAWSLADPPAQKVALLDPKRCMNISIFLKQFKRSAPEIVEDIRQGSGERYCGERLAELIKHLPEKEEVKRLKAFRGDQANLSEAEVFLMLLLDVPSYALRLEAMILRKGFQATVDGLRTSAGVLKESAQEILCCSELHTILRLVLKAGNFMNAGGYAGNAAGFHISSLLKLADTKANKPGMNLLHFVAMEVQKRYPDLLSFPAKLEHISSGCRLSEGGLVEEFQKLREQVSSLSQTLDAAEHTEIRGQVAGFLQSAQEQLGEVQREIKSLRSSRQQLLEFLCEDEETFKLEECCQIFSSFCDKFLKATKENKDREMEERRRLQSECERLEKRRSTATCSAIEDHSSQDDLALTLERNLQAACRYGSIRRTKARSPTINPARMAYFSCQGPWVRREREQDIETLSDAENARRLREVSETLLGQQMGYVASPEKTSRAQPEIAKGPQDQSPLENTVRSRESNIGLTSTDYEAAIQLSTVIGLASIPASCLPSNEGIKDQREISGQPFTKNVLERVGSIQTENEPTTAITYLRSHPSTRRRPPKSKTNSCSSIGFMPTSPEVNKQPLTGNMQEMPEVNKESSMSVTPIKPEVHNPPITVVNNLSSAGHVSARPDHNNRPSSCPKSMTPEVLIPILTEINNKPSGQNISSGPESHKQTPTENMPGRHEVNNQALTVLKVNKQSSNGETAARVIVHHLPSTVHMVARTEVNYKPSNEPMPTRHEISNQPPTRDLQDRPEINNQLSTGNIPAGTEVNNQTSTGNIPAGTEVNNQPSTGNIPAGTEVDNQPSTGGLPERTDLNKQPSIGNRPERLAVNDQPLTGNMPARPEVRIKPRHGPVLTRSLSTGPIMAEFPRVGETVECRTLVKGLKSYETITAHKAPPSPCTKWKREQQTTWESGVGEQGSPPTTSERVKSQAPVDRNLRSKDFHRDSELEGQKGCVAGTPKRNEREVGVRRVHSAKERSLVIGGPQDAKGLKTSSSPGSPLPSPQGTRPSSLIRRTTLPRPVQSKPSGTTTSEAWKVGSSKTRKELQTPGGGNVREQEKASSFTIRPPLTSPRKSTPQADSAQQRDHATLPVAQKGLTSPRPDCGSPLQAVTTPPLARRGLTSPRGEPVEIPRGQVTSPVTQGGAASPKTPLGLAKKTRVVTPVAAIKVVKHCDPSLAASTSQVGRSRRSGSQPIWR
ncbi:FH2 domain-containing protein 1-like [Ambystoma mexicanum]|uniref:FH2 domain-containing protein 1-like n=1 Tax=Ambystoma mexicanum TaxID=8296 RepID=UPI0037E7B62F